MASIDLASEAVYEPSDPETLLAGVGQDVTFRTTAINDGNVDVDNITVSNELFKNDAGGRGNAISICCC